MPLVFSMDGSDDVLDFASVNLTRNGSVPLQLQGRRLGGGDEGATPRTSFSWSAERNTVTLRVQGGSACEREMPYDRLGLALGLALTLTLTLTLALTLTQTLILTLTLTVRQLLGPDGFPLLRLRAAARAAAALAAQPAAVAAARAALAAAAPRATCL